MISGTSKFYTMIRSIIIDDEADARESLRLLLQKYCPMVEVISSCAGPEEGILDIQQKKPDLVFLDIQMPAMSGFDLLERVDHTSFQVIFVTAYDQYAIKAIRFSALDYLLKPVDVEELISAVKRVSNLLTDPPPKDYSELFHNIRHQFGKSDKLAVPTTTGLVFVDLQEIIYCKASGSYTQLILKGKKPIIVSKKLKDFTNILDPGIYCRVHHSAIINLNHIEAYVKGEGGYAIMSNGDHIDISRRKKEEFMKLISRL